MNAFDYIRAHINTVYEDDNLSEENRDNLDNALQDIERVEECLSRIAFPIWWGQEDAKRNGDKVDGHVLIALTNDARYLSMKAQEMCPEPPRLESEFCLLCSTEIEE